MKLLKVNNLPYTSFFASSIASSAIKPLSTLLPNNAESLAWTIFLQGSLVLGIWNQNSKLNSDNSSSSHKLFPMLIAFTGGVGGSVIGALVGCCTSSFFLSTGLVDPSVHTLRVVAACIAASYIGGTANFFETGKILLETSNTNSRYLNVVAGVDIAVMVIYFATLVFMRSSRALQFVFPPLLEGKRNVQTSRIPIEYRDNVQALTSKSKILEPLLSVVLLTMSVFIASFSSNLQNLINIPGISVMLSTYVA